MVDDLRRKKRDATREAVLTALSQYPSITEAARRASCDRSSILRWRAEDAEYDAACHDAVSQGCGKIADLLVDHGLHGVLEPVYQGGKQVGEIRRYDHRMMVRLMEVHQPEQWTPRSSSEQTHRVVGLSMSDLMGAIAGGGFAAHRQSMAERDRPHALGPGPPDDIPDDPPPQGIP